MTATLFDSQMERLEAGGALSPDDLEALATTPDIVSLGMLADTLRRRLRGTTVTYLRVACCALDRSFADAAAPAAREICITGTPDSASVAVTAVRSARAVAGTRTVSGLAWSDIERLTGRQEAQMASLLAELRAGGLDAIAELPLDSVQDMNAAFELLHGAGFARLRLTVQAAGPGPRTELWLRAADLQARYGTVQALNPLPMALKPFRPTTGYEDVRSVALARLAAPAIPSIQVDWMRYGPKLAQVALTFGADDVYGVSGSDEAPAGRRRAPLEQIRRNIEAAGFEAAERDGRYAPV